MERVATLISTSARLGLTRLYAPAEGGGLPPQSRDAVRASVATGSNLRSFVDEFAQADSSSAEAGSFTTFGAKPLVVLTAGTGAHGRGGYCATFILHMVATFRLRLVRV